jgi:glycine/D-amino acid oxidase-like deaminating enzyme
VSAATGMTAADVVVIGVGVTGLSMALHLARSGVRRVGVLERRRIAAGATGQSGAIVRTHYGNLPRPGSRRSARVTAAGLPGRRT